MQQYGHAEKKKNDSAKTTVKMTEPTASAWPAIHLASALCLSISIGHYYNVRRNVAEVKQSLNITGNGDPDLLIFNRVPKVGSTTIMSLVGELRSRNNFSAYTSLDNMPLIDEDKEMIYFPEDVFVSATIKAITDHLAKERPYAFLKHQNFLDFAAAGHRPPIYMNFVRHPVERIISWYYYVRAPWYQLEEDARTNRTWLKTDHGITVRDMKMSLEDCVERRHRQCHLRPRMRIHGGAVTHVSQMSFFCGQHKHCDVFEGQELFDTAVKVRMFQYIN